MTRLWLVRHGPTHQTAMTGWRDVAADLSDTAAIARLATCLPQAATLVASDLLRARTTADAIQQGQTRLPDRPSLREFDYGEWDAMTWQDIAARWPDLSRAYWETPGDTAPPGGECWHDGATRMSADIDHLLRPAPAELIVVAHMGVILTQLARALQVSPAQVLAQRIDPLSVSVVTVSPAGWVAGPINHCP